jgi:hypothetical protein
MNYTNFLYGLNYDELFTTANNIKEWSCENKFLYLLFGIVVLQELVYKNKLNKVLEQLTSKVSKDIYIDLYSDYEDADEEEDEDEDDDDYYEEEDEEDDEDEDDDEDDDDDYEEEEEDEEDDEDYEEDDVEEYNEEDYKDDIKLIYENNIKNMSERIKKLEKKCSDLENLVETIIVDKEEENFIDAKEISQ